MYRRTTIILLVVALGSCGSVAKSQEQIDSIQAPFSLLHFSRPTIPERSFNIRDFGAVEGGVVKITKAIDRAIHAAAVSGGGRVIVPEGSWLTGAIHFEDRIELHLEKGAELLFSQDPADYLPVVFSRHEDTECYKYSSFLYANGKHDIAVTGEGVLNGQGKPWWQWKTTRQSVEARLVEMGNSGVPVTGRVFDGTDGNGLRPAFFQPMRCTNVLVEGVTFLYGAFWTITPTYCENVIIRHVRIETEGDYGHVPNGDGIDPSSSRNVLIEYCDFATGDDCIAIKSGRDVDGRRVGRPTENVVIRHCRGRQGHGGIVIGSETAGGIRNIFAYDCHFSGTDRMVRIKTQRGRGGAVENMWFRDITGDRIGLEAIHVNMLYSGERLPVQPVTEATPIVRKLHFSNITEESGSGYAVEIRGIPEMPVRELTFDSLSMQADRGLNIIDATDLLFSHTSVTPRQHPVVNMAHCTDVSLTGIRVPPDIHPFLTVEGSDSRGIVLRIVKTPGIEPDIHRAPETSPNAVRVIEE